MTNRTTRKPARNTLLTLALLGLWALAWGAAPAAASPQDDYRLAYEAYARNDMAGTIKHLSTALNSGGLSAEDQAAAFYNRGLSYGRTGQTDLALQDMNQTLRIRPDNALALNNRGELWTTKGDFDLALRDFDQAIRINPRHAKAFYNRGLASFRRGDFERAVQDYTKAIQLKPDYAWAYANRGAAQRVLGRIDQAIADYDQAIRLKPDYAQAYYGRGNVKEAKELYDQAIADFAQAIRLEPAAPHYNRLAWLYATCRSSSHRDGKQALTYAQKAVQLRREAASLDTLAAAQARVGQTREAAATQKEALAWLNAQQVRSPEQLKQFERRLALYASGDAYAE